MNRSLSSRQEKTKTFLPGCQKWSPGFSVMQPPADRVAGWRLAIQSVLSPLGVVVVDELIDHCHKLFVCLKVVQIIHLALQNAPETFHRSIVDTSADARDILCVIFCLSSLALNCWLVYWKTRSLWNSGCASGYFWTAKSNVSKTSWLLLCLPMAKETISQLFKSRIALK